jgi:hypothetical protein
VLAFTSFGLCWIAVFAGLAIAGIVTGKTMTPLRGTRPFIVSRATEPGRFWLGIVTWLAFTAVGAWLISVAVLHP